ncbi:MAG: hypothetical protein ON057_001795 [Glomeribacter sp. 1016415]|nr:hypothetical protein [Glomeribacter sp. 1016415]
MRLPSIVLLSASVLMLPLTAHVGPWPAGKKGAYMDQCVQVATAQSVDAKTADKRYRCGADALEKNFTTKELEDLDSKDGVDAKLMMHAQVTVTQACSAKR